MGASSHRNPHGTHTSTVRSKHNVKSGLVVFQVSSLSCGTREKKVRNIIYIHLHKISHRCLRTLRMLMQTRTGPRTLLCGKPLQNSLQLDSSPLTYTLCCLAPVIVESQDPGKGFPRLPFLSVWSPIVCERLSHRPSCSQGEQHQHNPVRPLLHVVPSKLK